MNKGFIYILAASALLLAGCAKISTTGLYVPDESLSTSGEVTLCVSIEDLNTKITVDDNGHFLFREGDSIAVACSDGTFEKFILEGTGDTKRAFFKGTLPEGKTLGSCIVYPFESAVSCSEEELQVRILSELQYGGAFSCPAAGLIGSDYNVKLCQLASMFQVSVDKFPTSLSRVEFSDAGGKALSGDFSIGLSNIGEEGLQAESGSGSVSFAMSSSPTTAEFCIPMPAGDYSSLQMSFYGEDGGFLGSQSVSDYVLSFARAGYSRTEITSNISVKVKQVIVGEDAYALTETSSGVWEANVNLPASATLVFSIDSKLFGFASYAGAGGLGWCKNEFSALPYYNYTDLHTNYYYVSKAIGEAQAIENGGNMFWVNLDAPATARVVYDSNYGSAGSYYLEIQKDADPNVILDEQFDLFTCGGDVLWYLKGSQYGTDPAAYDGIAATTSNSAAWNASGSKNVMFDYPVAVSSTEASKEYMKNRGTSDWTFCRADERPSGVQLSQGSFDGYLVTPKFTGAEGGIKITLEISRYASTSKGDISVTLLGGGSFTGCKASQTWGKDTNGVEIAAKSGEPSASGTEFLITQDYCMVAYTAFNTSINKPRSTFEFTVTGATADSQLKVLTPSGTRCIVYGIKVEKI